MATLCDEYGFFNGIFGLEQSNWAKYWKGLIPDGIIAGVGNEMVVSRDGCSSNNQVSVGTGEAMIDNHKAWIRSQKVLDLTASASGKHRIDLVVLKCTYGNSGESKVEIDVIAGTQVTTGTTPTPATAPSSVTGGTYYVPLAQVQVGTSSVAITEAKITDLRYVFKLSMDKINTFSGNEITPLMGREYRQRTKRSEMTINLPANPHDCFITSVCFTSGNATWNGVNFKKGTENYNSKIKLMGDDLNQKSRRYQLIIWWDSHDWVSTTAQTDTDTGHYWCAAKVLGIYSNGND